MELRRLRLYNYRNYRELEVEFAGTANLILGDNGAGKTNLLEAIYYLGTGNSFRTRLLEEVIFYEAPAAQIEGLVYAEEQGEFLLTFLLTRAGQKEFYFHRTKEKLARAFQLFPVVLFSPDDLLLIKGEPFYRRQYLNLLLARAFPSYAPLLFSYRHFLGQRNALLRQLREKEGEDSSLSLWDEKLAAAGSKILGYRLQAITRLNSLLPPILEFLKVEKKVTLSYRAGAPLEAEAYVRQLAAEREKEIKLGHTLFGPHRDEVVVNLEGKDARFYASQGEQRLLALALRLGELAYLEQEGLRPVFLGDDLFSELDRTHRRAVLDFLREGKKQVFLTATEAELSPLEGKVFRVEAGKVKVLA